MSPTMAAAMDASSTPAAATSFAFFANGCREGLTKSTTYSIDELIASIDHTAPMHIIRAIHSVAETWK